jgi:hypothetical protein
VFETSQPVLLFDYFRVPYRTVMDDARSDLAWLRAGGAGERSLYWMPTPAGAASGFHQVASIPAFGHVAADSETAALRAGLSRSWSAEMPILDRAGERVASVWRDSDGSVFLPFDPAELVTNLWSEAYAGSASDRRGLALAAYYRLRPLLPRRLQLSMRRAYSHRQARRDFPRWPIETALHDLYDLLLRLSVAVAGAPVPYIAPWPSGKRWALVLTHDVETEVGYRNLHLLRDEEERAGMRSSWNFVPMRYRVTPEMVDDLTKRGFEVGVHGLYHDGRDLASAELLAQRLPAMREHAQRWGAVGFRSPATHRSWELMPTLGFDYDSSYPDTDPFEPQAGGCCTWLPYFNDGMVELPITLAQDHTLFVILGRRDEQPWLEKARAIRERGGMALLITHPDYLLKAHWTDVYARFLATFRDDPTVWQALPRDVSAWWRRRAESIVEPNGEGWEVTGPAAGEATVGLLNPV